MRYQFRLYKWVRNLEKEYDKTGGSIVPNKLEAEAIRKFMNNETETLDYDEELIRRIIKAREEKKLSSKGEKLCINSYRTVVRKDLENIPYSKCEKCGRVKQ